jgi:uncharacterized protein YkwD
VFVKDALDEHNRLRRMHGVPYLKLNRELCNIAQEWAEKVASTGKFEHSNNKYDGQSLGGFCLWWLLVLLELKLSVLLICR